jgi:hypothetical protein
LAADPQMPGGIMGSGGKMLRQQHIRIDMDMDTVATGTQTVFRTERVCCAAIMRDRFDDAKVRTSREPCNKHLY